VGEGDENPDPLRGVSEVRTGIGGADWRRDSRDHFRRGDLGIWVFGMRRKDVRLEGVEPPTVGSEVRCSIH
jgi:hypothetical protein